MAAKEVICFLDCGSVRAYPLTSLVAYLVDLPDTGTIHELSIVI